MKNYRGKFLIGIYSLLHEGETLLALCDNVTEFANYMQITRINASNILKHIWDGKNKFIRKDGKLRKVEFIEDDD